MKNSGMERTKSSAPRRGCACKPAVIKPVPKSHNVGAFVPMATPPPICVNGGLLTASNTCFCPIPFTGPSCERFAAEADIGYKAILISWGILTSGIMLWSLYRSVLLLAQQIRKNRYRTQAFACTVLTIIASLCAQHPIANAPIISPHFPISTQCGSGTP